MVVHSKANHYIQIIPSSSMKREPNDELTAWCTRVQFRVDLENKPSISKANNTSTEHEVL